MKNGWLSSGPPAFSRSQVAHLRRGLSQAGRSGPRFHPTAAAPLRVTSLLLAPRSGLGPGSSLPGRQRAGQITRLELGWRPHLEWCEWGGCGSGFWAEPGHPTLQQGPSGGQAGALKFRGRRRILGGARPGRDGLRRPPTQCSPGRRYQPEQRRTGTGNAPPIGQA